MGTSNTKNGVILIQLDKQQYNSGETVSGLVVLQVNKDIKCSHVSLTIKGYERIVKAKIKSDQYRNDDNNKPNLRDKFIAEQTIKNAQKKQGQKPNKILKKQIFYDNEFTLHVFDNEKIGSRLFQFPFSFKLKDNLPSSFYYAYKKNKEFQIKYFIYANLFQDKAHLICYDSMEFKVLHRLESYATYQQETISQKSFCIKDNQFAIQCMFDDHAYAPGQTVNIDFQINNSQSQFDIQTIEYSLIQLISVNQVVKVDKSFFKKTIVGVKKRKIAQGENKQTIQLQIPKELEKCPSINSLVIKNKFFISFKFYVDIPFYHLFCMNTYFANNPSKCSKKNEFVTVNFPISIGPKKDENAQIKSIQQIEQQIFEQYKDQVGEDLNQLQQQPLQFIQFDSNYQNDQSFQQNQVMQPNYYNNQDMIINNQNPYIQDMNNQQNIPQNYQNYEINTDVKNNQNIVYEQNVQLQLNNNNGFEQNNNNGFKQNMMNSNQEYQNENQNYNKKSEIYQNQNGAYQKSSHENIFSSNQKGQSNYRPSTIKNQI